MVVVVASNSSSWAVIAPCVWPKSSKLIMPNSCVQAASTRVRSSGDSPDRELVGDRLEIGGESGRNLDGDAVRRVQQAVAGGVGDDAEERPRHTLRRSDGVRRRPVAGDRRAVHQGVLVRVVAGPAPDGAARRRPPLERRLRRGALGGLLGRRTERVVGLDDEDGQQLVATGEVAVHARRHHADRSGDRPQGQAGRTDLGELAPSLRRDLGGDRLAGPCSHPVDGHVTMITDRCSEM